MDSQFIIPIFIDNKIKGIIRFSQLPSKFSNEDCHNFISLMPVLKEVFSNSTHSVHEKISLKTDRYKIFNTVKEIHNLLEVLRTSTNSPEVEKLILSGHENIETILAYLNPNTSNISNIQNELQQMNKNTDVAKEIFANVLIADDILINVQMLKAMLSGNQIINQIKYAYDGLETMEELDNFCDIHILFLDHHMPGLTGLEIAEKIREKNYLEGKIIIVSITNDPEIIAEKGYLYNYHIPKPFKKENVQAVMDKIRFEHFD